jgi:O-antigen/teichoic acid export membrane protein
VPRTLTYQAGLLTLSRAVGQVLNALAGILVVRWLAQFDYGTYRQLILIFSTLLVLGDIGFSQSLYHFISRQRENAGQYLGQAVIAVAIMASLLTAGLLAFSGPVARFFGNPQIASAMGLLAAYVSLSMLAQLLEAALITLERIGTASASLGIFEPLKFALILAALWRNGTVVALLWAMVIATTLRLIFMMYQLRDSIRLSIARQFSEQFRYAMSLWLPGSLNIAGIYAHQYIVGYYSNPAEYALYAVACFQVPLMGILSTSVGEVLLVRTTKHNSEGRREEIYRVWLNACRKSLLIFLPVTVGLAVLAKPLITLLFTERYAGSVPLFVLLILGLPFSGVFQDAVFRAYAAMRTYSFFYVLRAVLSIGFGVAGVKLLGLRGVALSTLATLAIVNLWQLVKVADLLKVSFTKVLGWRDIGKILLASAAAALPAAACARWLAAPVAALAVGLPLFGAVYLAMTLKLGLFSREETRTLLEEARAGFHRLAFLRTKAT